MSGMFLAALDMTIVSTSIRTIADDLHGLSIQAWATTAYLITSTIATPLYGKLSDLYGRRRSSSSRSRCSCSARCSAGLAQSMYQLATFRAVQGLGAGGLFSLALAIIGDIVPPRERARYQGYFLAVFGSSSVLGPVVGGSSPARTRCSASPAGAGSSSQRADRHRRAGASSAACCTSRTSAATHKIDILGAGLLSVGVVPLLLVAEQGRQWGWLTAARSPAT
jgi:MFS family permease